VKPVLQWMLLVFGLSAGVIAHAHEVRPAYLEISEAKDGPVTVRWRQPIMGEYTIAIAPVLSAGWLDGEPQRRYVTTDSLVKVWTVPAPHGPLAGQSLTIRGLDKTITDTLVRITFADGHIVSCILNASHPLMQIPATRGMSLSLPGYLQLGINHIWSGPDHLLYILGLILLISSLRSLVTTITAFTLAHSITLACAALGLIHLRPAPVEAVIALSIVYVAVELVRKQRGLTDIATRKPWIIAFVFGLLHGFGFAGALRQAGLPENSIASALFLFNVGIEVGQLLFVFMVLALVRLLHWSTPALRARVFTLAPYGIGSIASFWLIQRLIVIF